MKDDNELPIVLKEVVRLQEIKTLMLEVLNELYLIHGNKYHPMIKDLRVLH